MNRVLYLIAAVMVLTSCAETLETYNIQGSSMVSMDDDNKLALKVFRDYSLADLDSCEVVHGNFSFEGPIDSTRLGFIVLQDMMDPVPVIVETGGMITVSLERGMSHVSGTPLNDKLYKYLEHYNQLHNYLLSMHAKTIEQMRVRNEIDSLETRFIIDNSDNMAGMYVFMQMVSELMERQMFITPQLEMIMRESSESFRTHPYVINYYRSAKECMHQLQDSAAPASAIPTKEEVPQQNENTD